MNKCERCGDTEQLIYAYDDNIWCYDCCNYAQYTVDKPKKMERFKEFKREVFREGDLVTLFPDMVFGTFYSEGVKVHHILVMGDIRQVNKKLVYRRK
jgi:hypothetical protein